MNLKSWMNSFQMYLSHWYRGHFCPQLDATWLYWWSTLVNTLVPRQNGRHFADDIFKRIFFNENVWISIKISLKFVPKGPINIIPAMFRIMAWRRPGDKPLSEALLVSLLTHICVTRPQWVKAMDWGHQQAITRTNAYQVPYCHVTLL